MFSRTHIYIRGLRGLPITIFGLVICAVLSIVVINTGPAYAIENPQTTLDKGARGWYALRFIRDHNRINGTGITTEDVEKMSYIPQSSLDSTCWQENAGYLLEPVRGTMARDAGWWCGAGGDTTAENAFNTAFQGIGYDRTTFIIAMGYTKQASGLYEGGNITDTKLNSALSSANVSADLKGSALNMPSVASEPAGWMQYLDLLAGIEKGGCLKAGLREFPDPAGNISLVDPSDLTVKKYRVEAQAKNVKVAVGADISCAQAIQRLSDGQKARSYIDAYNSLIAAAPKTCEQLYRDAASRDACIDGFNNKTVAGYCSKYGPGTPNYNACVAGQSASGATGTATIDPPVAATAPGEKTQTCGISSIGWIVCPVMTFLADINDQAYDFIAENFLSMDATEYFSDTDTKVAWEVFRNYSNVIFIIMFLIIVYSQVTSAGISNYGIKKMLPRLLIIAILVNISYYICVLAVDVSNVLGYGVQEMFAAIIPAASSGGGGGVIVGNDNKPLLWAGVIAGAIAGTAITVGLAASVPVLLSALLALAMILLILVGRKAIIILLVIISPLAFAASLLPNTESLFKKWWKMFSSLLLLFPVIAAVFGASRLAASILASIDENLETQVAALAASVIPFFVVPSLLKGALAATGSLGAKLQGAANKATGNVGSRAKSGAKSTFNRRTAPIQDAWKYRKQSREIERAKRRGAGGVRTGVLGAVGGGNYADKLATQAASLEENEFNEQVKAASASVGTMSTGEALGQDAAGKVDMSKFHGSSEAEQAAIIEHVMAKGSFNERRALVEASGGLKGKNAKKLQKRISDGVYAKGDQNIYGAGIGAKIVTGTISSGADLRAETLKNINDGHVSAEHLVQGESATEYMVDTATGATAAKIDPTTGAVITPSAPTGVGTSADHAAAATALRASHAAAQTNTGTRSKLNGAFNTTLGRL